MPKFLLWLVISLLILSTAAWPARSEYFSNMRGAQIIDSRQASAKAFVSIAQLMTGLTSLELADEPQAKVQLAESIRTMKQAAWEFQALAETNATVPLDVKFPDALTELAQTSEVPAEKIATVGDVLTITSQSLTTGAEVLDKFLNEPTKDNYTALRKSIENILRTGDLSSKLLQ
jgi:hypothetical protein